MIELPESLTLARQIDAALAGKTITEVFNSNSPHKFTFFNGDPQSYGPLLRGRKVLSAEGRGAYVIIHLSGGMTLAIGDGVNMRLLGASDRIPQKYQLLLAFDDGSALVFTVAMYGMIYAFEGELDNKYYRASLESLSPLSDAFDLKYFLGLIDRETKDISAKALLATGQRIPGVGNGTTQDILFNAGINPKRKIRSLGDDVKKRFFTSLKTTLKAMAEGGGRDTESDLYGNRGGYRTVLSSVTSKEPCPKCGGDIRKEAYLGGSVYYCPVCQKL